MLHHHQHHSQISWRNQIYGEILENICMKIITYVRYVFKECKEAILVVTSLNDDDATSYNNEYKN